MTMQKSLSMAGAMFLALASMFIMASAAHADAQWDTTGTYVVDFEYMGGLYPHDMELAQDGSGNLTGVGGGHPAGGPHVYTWIVTGGSVVGNTVTITAEYTATADAVNPLTEMTMTGVIAEDGSMSGTWNDNYQEGYREGDWETTSGAAEFITHGMIVEPEENEIVTGMTDLVAWYHDESPDDNDDGVQWAVRQGTCAAGVNNVFGNVDGMTDPFTWDGKDFSAQIDTEGLAPGMYCFVFNPTDDAGQNNVRETREFYVAESYVNGGGQIIEQIGSKQKDWYKVSFGGWVADVGSLMGEWQVNVHNVSNDTLDGGKFHTTEITALNMYDPAVDNLPNDNSCVSAMNFEADGTWNGEEGYSMIFRAADNLDSVRIELFKGGALYDTLGDFTVYGGECVGDARTELDNGNISIVDNS